MERYNDQAYKSTIETLISESFYFEKLSNSTKLSNIRKYLEIITRRILKYPNEKNLLLGHEKTLEQLSKKGFYSNSFFKENYDIIKKLGNNNSHTKIIPNAGSDEDVIKAQDALINIYSFLFYDYFTKYRFGHNLDIIRAFSILPPILRFNCLSLLHDNYPENMLIIDKLVLSMVKSFDNNYAISWVNKNKDYLSSKTLSIPYGGVTIVTDTYYNVFINKASLKYPPLYKTLEEAIKYYEVNGIVEGDTDEINEFNKLMAFIYIGRKKSN
ncbi:MAG: hypothetical protein MJ108_09260 [Saccharofermentans sp.]|nr:hypothetical protein [Saccharofermentans sp.]